MHIIEQDSTPSRRAFPSDALDCAPIHAIIARSARPAAFTTEPSPMHARTRAMTPPERAPAVARHMRTQAAGALTNPKCPRARSNPSTPSPKRTQAADTPAEANHRHARSNPRACPAGRQALAADVPMHRPIEAADKHTRTRATPSPKRTRGADTPVDATIGVHVRTQGHGRQVAGLSRLRRRCMDPWERAGCTLEPEPARRGKEPEAPSAPPTRTFEPKSPPRRMADQPHAAAGRSRL